jgi:CRP/FNR family transcriptional activator FtrB
LTRIKQKDWNGLTTVMDHDLPLTAALASQPIFAGVSDEGLRDLHRASIVHQAPRGLILFEQGAEPSFQAVVLEGAIHLLGRSTSGHEMVIETVEAPGLLLPAAVASGAPYLMSARCITDARVLMIKADVFRGLLTREPSLALALVARLSDQLRAMVRQIKTLKLRSGPQRVAAYLIALSRSQGSEQAITLPYEKGLIASQLGMTRESFSRILTSLQRGPIEMNGQSIHIRDHNALLLLSEPDPLIDGPELFGG